MFVLGLSGTPKRGGLTDSLLDKALEGARSGGAVTEKIVLNELSFKPCQECDACRADGECHFIDDMQVVYAKFASADAFVVASPIYFCTISAQLKMMIDRFQSVWVGKTLLKKRRPVKRRGIFLCVAGQEKEDYFESAKKVVKALFVTADIEYAGELFFGGYNVKSTDKNAKEQALDKAFELGAGLAIKHE